MNLSAQVNVRFTAGHSRRSSVEDRSDQSSGAVARDRIGQAIAEACSGWRLLAPDARLDRDSHYQLANRLAFTWKLATLGIPVVLLYLGFTGVEGITDAGEPVRDHAHWQALFSGHALDVGLSSALERRLEFGAAPSWVLCRSRAVLERSPPRPRSGRQG